MAAEPQTAQPDDHFGKDVVGFNWTEEDSRDDRWQLMQTGPFFSGTIGYEGGHTLKGLAIKLGDEGQASLCFDTELLRVSCGWTGGFLKFNSFRFGLISAPLAAGTLQFSTRPQPGCSATDSFNDLRPAPQFGPLPREQAHYQGLSLNGSRVVLRYSIGQTNVLESPWAESNPQALLFTREWEFAAGENPLQLVLADGPLAAEFVGEAHGARIERHGDGQLRMIVPPRQTPTRLKVALWSSDPARQAAHRELLASSPAALDLQRLSQPGPARWGAPLVTRGVVSEKDDPYVVDTLTLPLDNPYRALMFTSGHDFFANGDAAVCTAHGDVWIVGGIDDQLDRLIWKRFATGLFQPLGLKIVKYQGTEHVFVLGRDQITLLIDANQDGEADDYQNFNNDGQVTTNSHEFATCLETDSQGNFYYLKGDSNSQTAHDGCLLKVSPDGQKLSVFATGFRNANGMSIGPDDTITVAPQEGTWTPGSAIFQVREGGFYGAMQSHHRPVAPTTYEPPICWLPRLQDNSSGGQAWVTSHRWGPLGGQLLHFSFGTCRMFLTLREPHGEHVQGGTIAFPLVFDSGIMRGRFHPGDGQLYVTGLKGWVSSAVQDGCFQRVRYTGRPVDFPVKMETLSNGVTLTFTEPLDRESAEDPDNYGVETWNYLWSSSYGSPDLKVSTSNQVGHDELEVVSATLLPDGKSVFLELPELQPAMQVAINYTLRAVEGREIRQTFNATIHELGREPQAAPLARKARSGQLSAELEQSLRPGLWLQIQGSGQNRSPELAVSRLAALSVNPREVSLVAGPSAAVSATWTGYLKVPQKGQYQFRVISRQQTRLKLGDDWIEPEVPVTLRRGYLPFYLACEGTGEIDIRTEWKGEGFPWESVPPTLLSHGGDLTELEQAHARRHGGDLFQQHGCGSCHQVPVAGVQPVPGATHGETVEPSHGPSLENLGDRLNPDWIRVWLKHPAALRNETHMPELIHGEAADVQQTIADLTAFLTGSVPASVAGGVPGPTSETDFSRPELIDAGLQLYEALGCIGCHRLTPPTDADPFQRVSLGFVAQKFLPGSLAGFLVNPRHHAPHIRMPDFRLSPDEADALEAYLRSSLTVELPESAQLPGDAGRGRVAFTKLGCQQCHATTAIPAQRVATAGPVWGTTRVKGCLHAEQTPRTTPRYDFDPEQTRDLLAYLKYQVANGTPEFDTERTARQMTQLRCQTCHSRDGQNSPLAEILSEEGQGLPPEMFPHLTWAGEKLRADWIERLLSGQLKYTTRPWLKARMPSFSAPGLARGLAAEHGIGAAVNQSPVVASPVVTRPDLVETGLQLTLKGQGLDCRQCHGLGQEKPSGDHATLISVGINFSHIPDRLNPDFFPRLMMNPPRYDPNSRMPVFAVDGKSTAARQILNGDAQQQYEAIWHYLQTLKR